MDVFQLLSNERSTFFDFDFLALLFFLGGELVELLAHVIADILVQKSLLV